MKRVFYLLVGLVILLLSAAQAAPTEAQTSTTFELGGQILDFSYPEKLQDAAMTWMKMQITYNRGAGGSTADAQNVITHARNFGFKVLLSIKGLKNELSANPTQYYNDYADFVRRVALLNPEAIEVWNEPNIDAEWPAGSINGTNYTNLLKKAYPAIKGANANVMVISGAPSPTGYFGGGCASGGCDDKIFIEQMKAAGAVDYFDCTGIHYNEGVLPPTATSGDPRGNPNHYTRYYPTMVSTYRTVFPTKPLCFTELGYVSPDGLGGLPPGLSWGLNTSVQEQANWLAQAATKSRDDGIVRLMVVWNMNTAFTPSNPMAGWAIIRNSGQCLACGTLAAAMSKGPKSAPTLSAPANANVSNNAAPTFSWTSVSDATSYKIVIDNNSNLGSPERTGTPTGTSYTPSPNLTDGVYYWRVRGVNADGEGPWSTSRQFTVDTQAPAQPTIIGPGNNTGGTNAQPLFAWNTVSGAVRYEMRLGGSNPPTRLVLSANQTQYQQPYVLVAGAYYWQLRTIDAAGNASAWTTPYKRTVTSLLDAAPIMNYYTTAAVTLAWGGVSGATDYEIQVDSVSTFPAPLEFTTTTDGNTLQATTSALSNGVHYWRVRARRNGSWGTWSAVSNFQVNVP